VLAPSTQTGAESESKPRTEDHDPGTMH
jgi:hypothetical protein